MSTVEPLPLMVDEEVPNEGEMGFQQPLQSVSYTRAWHWGIFTVSDPNDGGFPTEPEDVVTGNEHGLIMCVVHPYESELSDKHAEATVRVVLYYDGSHLATGRRVLYEGAVLTPRSLLAVGDADGEVIIGAHRGMTWVRVSAAPDADDDRLADVLLELVPVHER